MPKQDPLIASTLVEAEQHRETFKTLARDNESIRAGLVEQKAKQDQRDEELIARGAQQLETAQSQAQKADELAQLEQALKDQQLALDNDRDAFESKKQTTLDDLVARAKVVEDGERDLTSARTVFEKEKRETTSAHESRDVELTDREARLRAGEEQFKTNSLKLEEDRKTYKAKVKEEVTAEILKNVGK